MNLDVGCGCLPQQRRRGDIGIDLNKGKCQVVADAHYLPFRDDCFSGCYARNVLEHLVDPMKCLGEMWRVLIDGGRVSISIPVFHNQRGAELVRFVFNFPLRILRTLKRIWHWHKHGRKPGFQHLNRIQPKHVARVFRVDAVYDERSSYYPLRVLQKLGYSVRCALLPVQTKYVIATKEEVSG